MWLRLKRLQFIPLTAYQPSSCIACQCTLFLHIISDTYGSSSFCAITDSSLVDKLCDGDIVSQTLFDISALTFLVTCWQTYTDTDIL